MCVLFSRQVITESGLPSWVSGARADAKIQGLLKDTSAKRQGVKKLLKPTPKRRPTPRPASSTSQRAAGGEVKESRCPGVDEEGEVFEMRCPGVDEEVKESRGLGVKRW